MEVSDEPTSSDSKQNELEKMETKKVRSTDHKVYRREPTESGDCDDGEFSEKKKRGKRMKRKKPTDSGDQEKSVTDGAASTSMDVDNDEAVTKKPHFKKLTGGKEKVGRGEIRKVKIPPNRLKPLKENWLDIYNPLVKHLNLQVRYNVKAKRVEMKSCAETEELTALQKAEEFIKAFAAGFEVQDALALIRLDDLYLESFQVQDVKTLRGDHLSRAIGRITGCNGKTKYTIENVTKTRIVVAGSKINILGTFHNIAAARRAISNLILGSPPSKVYGTMRSIAAKVHDRL